MSPCLFLSYIDQKCRQAKTSMSAAWLRAACGGSVASCKSLNRGRTKVQQTIISSKLVLADWLTSHLSKNLETLLTETKVLLGMKSGQGLRVIMARQLLCSGNKKLLVTKAGHAFACVTPAVSSSSSCLIGSVQQSPCFTRQNAKETHFRRFRQHLTLLGIREDKGTHT